jgi:nicotinamide-nucleotide amidase
VDPALIESHGAVSEPVADAMAEGALRRFEADTAVAITGIAGPDGGTEEKPVGTVCFTVKLADGRGVTTMLRLPGDRADVRDRSTTVAMHLLRRVLSEPAAEVTATAAAAREPAPADSAAARTHPL